MDRIELDEEFKDKLLIGFAQRFLSEGKCVQNVFTTTIFNDEEGKNYTLETIKKHESVKNFYIELVKNDPNTCRALLKRNINYFSPQSKVELLKGLCKDKKLLLESIMTVDFTFGMQRVIFDNCKDDEEIMSELCKYAFKRCMVRNIDTYAAKLKLRAADKKILRQYAVIFKLEEGGK
mgnify:FL=1